MVRGCSAARLPTAVRLTGGVKGPTNTSSFLHVQQGGEVEAALDLAAAQGREARGLWFSEKRQAGGPGEHALRFGTIALPMSVGAQRVSQGPALGRETGSRKDTTSLRPRAAQGPAKDLFDTTLFQYKQSRKKIKSLWGRGQGKNGLCGLGAHPPSPSGQGGPKQAAQQGERAPGMTECMARGQGLQFFGASRSHWGGAAQAPLKTRMIQKKAEPPKPVFVPHALCFLGQHYAHSTRSRAQGR